MGPSAIYRQETLSLRISSVNFRQAMKLIYSPEVTLNWKIIFNFDDKSKISHDNCKSTIFE